MTAASPLSPVRVARQRKILDAAERLFARQGYRATTMEGVAAKVGMSKVTVYGYFPDKDALFLAVAVRVAERLAAAETEALGAEAPLADRVRQALIAKHRIVYDLVRTSPFARELFAAKDEIAGDIFGRLAAESERRIATVLMDTGHPPTEAHNKARLLTTAAQGVADYSATLEIAEVDIAALVDALLPSPTKRG